MDSIPNNSTHHIDWSKITTSIDTSVPMAAIVEDTVPKGIRWLIKRDGTKTLQAGFVWWQGNLSGINWKDVPVVVEEHPDKL